MQSSEEVALVDDRHQWLLDQLAEDRRITTNAAADALDVSVDTIRRDLRLLHDQGLLRRVHGGAVPLSPLSPSFAGREADHSPERARLAGAVVARFGPGHVIGLDAGTTTTEIAAAIPQSLEVTIVTNNPAAAVALGDHRSASVILLGGDVDLQWMATTGAITVDAFRRYQLDIAVVGACSFDLAAGATTRSQYEVDTKQAMIAAAAETIVPLESAKLGTVSPFRIAGPTDVGLVVLKDAVATKTVTKMRRAGVDITSV